jgi:hypothetical protein
MNEKPNRKWGWRLLRRGLIGLAMLVTLVAALVTEENWRAKRAWENYKRAAEARGERFDLASIVPPEIPDDQNFFCAPIMARAFAANQAWLYGAAKIGTNLVTKLEFDIYRGDAKLWPQHGGNWQKGTFTDLAEWQEYFQKYNNTSEARTNGFPAPAQPGKPAADVLTALTIFDPPLEELRQATARPYARMPVNYTNGFEATGKLLPWLARVKACGQFLQLRMLAELENGQSGSALEDLKCYLRLTDSIQRPRFLISELVRIAMLHIALQPIYEGLARHRWSDAQLAELERELNREDMLEGFVSSMKVEKICAIEEFQKLRRSREYVTAYTADGDTTIITNKLKWVPAAFFYQNQLCTAKLDDEAAASLINLTNRVISPAAFNRISGEIHSQKSHFSPYNMMALMSAPAVLSCVKKTAVIQANLGLARAACALDRYWLAHGEYPETLDVLVPHFIEKLPHDIINGQPLHYRRVESSKFVLYSVGWNETDDGGVTAFRESGSVDSEKGDWVWKN